ncbi:hypothetical protein RF11_11134 [Thelohanellus kitauei]|uniref:Uncharacterized protein n=1 Tax=Thelohanellus kitauei TaxID=669202 RepID=A0A0C2J8T2_THEKT|nr:hypothetical protein RF11_11134 [Thelohanellus kitauei]
MHFCDHIITSRMVSLSHYQKFEYHEVDKNKIVDIRLENVDLYSQYKLPEIQTGSTIDRELALGVLRRETTDSMIFNILIEDSKTKYEEDEIFKNDIIDRDIKAIVLHPMMGYSSFKHLQKSTINDVDFKKAENTLNDLSILNSSILKSKTVILLLGKISEDSENLKSKKVDKFTDSMVLISPIDSGVTEESNQQPLGSRQFATLACITESSGTLNSVMLRSRYVKIYI